METGGISMKSILQRSNPLQTVGCDNDDCLPFKMGRGGGGDCEVGGINYDKTRVESVQLGKTLKRLR